MDAAELRRHRLLGCTGSRTDHRGVHWASARTAVSASSLPSRSPLRISPDIRCLAFDRGSVPPELRGLGPAVSDPAFAFRRHQSWFYVLAELPHLGDLGLAGSLPGDLVRDRAHAAWLLPASGD